MLIRYGYELTLNCQRPTTMGCLLDAHRERLQDLRYETPLMTMPEIATSTYLDTFGNTVRRFIAPAGDLTLSRDAVIENSGVPDAIEEDAKEVPVEQLPNDTLVFMLGSRYCETDKLADIAWQLFGSKPAGWPRVQAICDFVCDRLTFGYEHARSTRTAFEAYEERKGVCRDFAHLAVAFCRCMNIPARYANGFLGDIGVPPDPSPMDYNAWLEVYPTDVGSRATRATMYRALVTTWTTAAALRTAATDAVTATLATDASRRTPTMPPWPPAQPKPRRQA